MLPRLNRLTKNRDFQKVYDHGQTYRSSYLMIKISKNGLPVNRFGIVVSKKVSKKAVIRNRIKRQIRDLLSKEIFQLESGCDIIVITYPKIKNQEYETIKKNLMEVSKKVKAL